MSETTVYRLFCGNELVYVGIAGAGMKRLDQHRRQKSWWSDVTRAEFSHHPSREEAASVERSLIGRHRPRYNDRLKPAVVPEGCWSLADTAAWLRVHENTVSKLVRLGKLPVLGRTDRGIPFFDPRGLDEWVSAGKAALPTTGDRQSASRRSNSGSTP